jgi:hypothetical protein
MKSILVLQCAAVLLGAAAMAAPAAPPCDPEIEFRVLLVIKPNLNPRDEIFLHEWIHGLDGFYGSKIGVRLPTGVLHDTSDLGYREKPWRPGDTFRGWMEWYWDYLNGKAADVAILPAWQ